MLIRIPAVLSSQALIQAQAWLAEAQWESGAASAGTQATLVKNN